MQVNAKAKANAAQLLVPVACCLLPVACCSCCYSLANPFSFQVLGGEKIKQNPKSRHAHGRRTGDGAPGGVLLAHGRERKREEVRVIE